MISRISRLLAIPSGHIMIFGDGAEGRCITGKAASVLLGMKFVEIEDYESYDKTRWQNTIRQIIRNCGSLNENTVVCLQFHQLKRHPFLVEDLDNFLTNGFISDLFSSEDMQEINENVHKLMVEVEDGFHPVDITPAVLENEFIRNCEKNLHVMIVCNNEDTSVFDFFNDYPSFFNQVLQYRNEEWPNNTLNKAGDLIFEDLNVPRETKKPLNILCRYSYEETRKAASEVPYVNIVISPAVYMRLLSNIVRVFTEKNVELEEKRSKIQMGIDKFAQVEEQVKEFDTEYESLKVKISEVTDDNRRLDEKIFELKNVLSSDKEKYEEESSEFDALIYEKNKKENIYKDKLNLVEEKHSGLKAALMAMKPSEIQALKNVKFNLPVVKLCLQCLNLIMNNDVEKGIETEPKKLLDFLKRILNDGKFITHLLEVEISSEALEVLKREILPNPEWDHVAAHKISHLLEFVIKWVNSLYEVQELKKEVEPYILEVQELEVKIREKKDAKSEAFKSCENNEVLLSSTKDKLKKVLTLKADLITELDKCAEKITLGNQILERYESVVMSWKNTSSRIKALLSTLIGDAASYCADITLLSVFNVEKRKTLVAKIANKVDELKIPRSENYLENFLEPETRLSWSHFAYANDDYCLSKLCALQSGFNWPYVFNMEDEGMRILLEAEKERKIEFIRKDQNSDYMRSLEKAISAGTTVVLKDVTSYDTRLKHLLSKNIIMGSDGNEESKMCLGDKLIPYSKNFKLFLVSSSTVHTKYQSKCQIINFDCHSSTLKSILVSTILCATKSKEKMKLDNVVSKMIKTGRELRGVTEKILKDLDVEQGILYSPGLGAKLMKKDKEFARLSALYENLQKLRDKLTKSEEMLESYAFGERARIAFDVVRRLRNLDDYNVPLQKFIGILKNSLEKSSEEGQLKSDILKALSGMFYEDSHRLTFAFWLCLDLYHEEEKLKGFEHLKELLSQNSRKNLFWDWRNHIKSFGNLFNKDTTSLEEIFAHPSWNKIRSSNVLNTLPVPLDSQLNSLERFELKARLRPDNILEWAKEFVLTYISLEYFSESAISFDDSWFDSIHKTDKAIVLSISNEEGTEEELMIQKLALGRNIKCSFLIFEEGSSNVMETIKKAQKIGGWIILKNCPLHYQGTLRTFLVKSNFQIHKDYQLWIFNFNRAIPKETLHECIICNRWPPESIKRRILSVLYNIRPEKAFWSPNLNRYTEEDSKRPSLYFRLVMFHSAIVERTLFDASGGWNCPYNFKESHFRIVYNYFKKLSFDVSKVSVLKVLIRNVFYEHYFVDKSDRHLFCIMLDHTLDSLPLKDPSPKMDDGSSALEKYAEGLDDNFYEDALKLSLTTRIKKDLKNSRDFLESLTGKTICEELSKFATESDYEKSISRLDSMISDDRSQGPKRINYILKFIWMEEIRDFQSMLKGIQRDIFELKKVHNKEKLKHKNHQALEEMLKKNRKPNRWRTRSDLDQDNNVVSLHKFFSWLRNRIEYLKTEFQSSTIPLLHLSNPTIFLNGVRFYLLEENLERNLNGLFMREVAEADKVFYLKDVVLQGADWDNEKEELTQEINEESDDSIYYLSISAEPLKEGKKYFSCPLYLTSTRRHSSVRSSYLYSILIPTSLSETDHVKMRTAITIDNSFS